MSDHARVAVLRMVAGLGGVAAAVVAAASIREVGFGEWLVGFGFWIAAYSAFFAVFTWLVAPRQPRNPIVWIMAGSAFFGGIVDAGFVLAFSIFPEARTQSFAGSVVPADLPTGAAMLVMAFSWTWVLALLPQLTFGLLLFPNGRLPSRRWRWAGFLAAFGIVMTAIASAWTYRPSNTGVADEGTFLGVAFVFVFAAGISAVVSLIVRFRGSKGEVRQQIKWVLWGAGIFALTFMGPGFLLGETEYEYLLIGPAYITEAIFITSYGIAVGKYRLYDVDLVISRTFVYGSLAILITALYVAIVVGLGFVFGGGSDIDLWLGIGATVVIAMAFQPLRRRLQRLANRIVYGRRATPYEVLSSLSQQVAVVDRDVLIQVARSLTEGTTATAASIWSARSDLPRLLAIWPSQQDQQRGGDPDESYRTAQIVHDGEILGHVRMQVPSGQPFLPTDEELLDQVASGLGLALRNLLLTEDLRARVDQLRESRRRVVALQDQTRQLLERDLHDGAQQRLVALKIKVGIATSLAAKERLEDVTAILDTVRGETDLTIESLRNLARGIYPPLLEAEGLEAALTAQLRRSPLPVTVQAAGIGRYPREVEATVYFCVLEAVQNAVKHSRAKSVLVTIGDDEGRLGFEVRDDGIGFDVGLPTEGSDLQNMADRLDALNGTLHISASAHHGTKVVGSIPFMEVAVR